MIRNNKQLKPNFDFQNSNLISYRNAVYQGQYNHQKQEREGRGIIYIPNNHHFIACNNFHSNQISDEALFYVSHSRYHYGHWLNNQPHGLCVFRMNQILIFTQYKRGQLKAGTNVLFIFQKYSQGIIIEIEQQNRWSIRSKNEVFTFEQMQTMLQECKFNTAKLSPSLVKFLNKQFALNIPGSFKLRLINNQYRYGFDNGLAIFFDDQYQISTVGCHQKNNLCDVGIKYGSIQIGSIIEEGIFDGENTFVYEHANKPTHRVGQMYLRYHLSSINFKNSVINDPSESYFRYFQSLMNQKIFKATFSQLILNSSLQNQNVSFGRVQNQNKDDKDSSRRYEKLQFQQLQIPTFIKPYKQIIKSKPIISEESSSIKQDIKPFNIRENSFQRLSEKNRLQVMKQEIYNNNSVKQRQFPAKLVTQRSNKDEQSSSIRSNMTIKQSKHQKSQSNSVSSKRQLDKRLNLEQKIDIIIRQPPIEQTPPKSRSKKKIFQHGKSIKRDYSPQTQVSPFKSRMKARIFDPSFSRSRSKSNKKIYTKEEKQVRINKSPFTFKNNNDYLSPHLQMGLSLQKSNSSSRIGNFPVMMAKNSHSSRQSQRVEDEDSKNIRTIKQSKTNLKEMFNNREDQYPNMRKANNVYRNPMIKGGYNQYVYEPINIKEGNKPYIKDSSLKSLSRNKSNYQIIENSYAINSKKQIGETSPLKKIKMGNYLNHQEENKPNQKYSNYKKRTGYF